MWELESVAPMSFALLVQLWSISRALLRVVKGFFLACWLIWRTSRPLETHVYCRVMAMVMSRLVPKLLSHLTSPGHHET